MIKVDRALKTDEELDIYRRTDEGLTLKDKAFRFVKGAVPKNRKDFLYTLGRYLPIVDRFRKYKIRSYLKGDVISGITIGVLQIPQGLAYAGLATLEPVAGLYTMFIPPLIYFLFGSSNYMHLGTVAINSLLMANSVTPSVLSKYINNRTVSVAGKKIPLTEDVAKRILTCNITLFVGIVQFGLLLTVSEFVSRMLSPTMISGFTFGASIQAFVSQLLPALGMSIPKSYFKGEVGLTVQRVIYIFTHIKSVNVASLLISLFSIASLLACTFTRDKVKSICPIPIPGELILIIILTGISYGFDFAKRFRVPIVGFFPKGLPKVITPDLAALSLTIQSSLIIGFVSFVTAMSMGKALGQIYVDTFRGSQDLFTLGLSNIVGSFFGCLPPGASLSRSILHGTLGKSQFYSIFASLCVLIVLLVAAPLLYPTPRALLGSIVIVALVPVYLQIRNLRVLVRKFRSEAFVWIMTALTGILVSTEYSVAVGFGANILVILLKFMMAKTEMLGNVENTELYRDKETYNVENHGNLLVLSFDQPIIYMNRGRFENSVLEKLAILAPENEPGSNFRMESVIVDIPMVADQPQKSVIIDISKVAYIDSSGLKTIIQLISKFELHGVNLYFSGANVLIRQLILDEVKDIIFFPTVYDAVSYLQTK